MLARRALPFRAVTRNGRARPTRPQIEITHTAATVEEAAAVAAAIEQFLRDTAPAPAPPTEPVSRWKRTGLLESTQRMPLFPSNWGDPNPWGAAGGRV